MSKGATANDELTSNANSLKTYSVLKQPRTTYHDSGDVILWPSRSRSYGDDGTHAVARWSVSATTVAALVDSGEVDEVA